jgi:hypothetical protein
MAIVDIKDTFGAAKRLTKEKSHLQRICEHCLNEIRAITIKTLGQVQQEYCSSNTSQKHVSELFSKV